MQLSEKKDFFDRTDFSLYHQKLKCAFGGLQQGLTDGIVHESTLISLSPIDPIGLFDFIKRKFC